MSRENRGGTIEDLVFAKGFLTPAEQRDIVAKVLRIEPGLYVPVLRTGAKMSLRMNCLGHHWSARTYKYTKVRDVDGQEAAPIPDYLQEAARRVLVETDYWRGPGPPRPFDVCIVNLYAEDGGKLGVHVDNSETAEALASGYPVVSLSVGATAVFTVGGLSRKDPQVPHLLESGDAVIFGRSQRLVYHGVTRLLRGTTPVGLRLPEPGRLNFTFRVL